MTAGREATRRALPEFPWDSLAGAAAVARSHHDGVVDLSVGTPVDPVPDAVGEALRAAWDSPGYPQTWGTPALRQAVVDWFARRRGVPGLDPQAVLPTVGSKELVAWLPTLLGLGGRDGADDVVAFPHLAYPTYEVGARLAGTRTAPVHDDEPLPEGTRLVWLNSPSNPTGRVLDAGRLADRLAEARALGAVVASDECYLALPGPGVVTTSVLDPAVHGGDVTGLLAVHSLSKTSNLAGYRAGLVLGDPVLVADLLQTRKHAGMIVPRPVQEAMTAALRDDEHVAATRARYDARRAELRPALEAAGLRVEHSEAGLYLWATAGEPCRATVDRLAARGILVAPGEFYGPAGEAHVRVALTASDERIAAAAERLAG
ncbi:MAG: N-succinyl-L,L-diaminopimelate aminotransferase, type 2 [uncultured Actinomycetospora sp.]|uniref:N-succinyl-L,L-diaminopimelate aminotransferase, type 2 n=1 Tax=uncultured Actinomycetospora sp. TaxID=1135996 RepID=A0A6J4IF31_9PSEU|nr:MAG: N-succinyl-L,L-diaminopimelate aminotransferase, type 2 [uncultured Actinomycetospora sp.]